MFTFADNSTTGLLRLHSKEDAHAARAHVLLAVPVVVGGEGKVAVTAGGGGGRNKIGKVVGSGAFSTERQRVVVVVRRAVLRISLLNA